MQVTMVLTRRSLTHWPLEMWYSLKLFSGECHWQAHTEDYSTWIGELTGSKPLPEPMLTHIISPYDITRPQWVKRDLFSSIGYHGCWWPGNSRSHGISSNAICLVPPPYLEPSIMRIYYINNIYFLRESGNQWPSSLTSLIYPVVRTWII